MLDSMQRNVKRAHAKKGHVPTTPTMMASEAAMALECSLSPELSQLLSTSRGGLHFGFGMAISNADKPKSPGDRPSVIVSYISGANDVSKSGKKENTSKRIAGQREKLAVRGGTSRKEAEAIRADKSDAVEKGQKKRPAVVEFETTESVPIENASAIPTVPLNFDPKKVMEYVSTATRAERGALWIDGASAARHDISWEPHAVGMLKAPPQGPRSQLPKGQDNRGTALRSPPHSARDGVLIRVVDEPGLATANPSFPSTAVPASSEGHTDATADSRLRSATAMTPRSVHRPECPERRTSLIQHVTTSVPVTPMADTSPAPQVSVTRQSLIAALPTRQRPSSAASHGQRRVTNVASRSGSRNETPRDVPKESVCLATGLPWQKTQGSIGVQENGAAPSLTEVSCCRWGAANLGGKRQLLRAAVPCEGEISNLIHEVQRRGNPTARHRPASASANFTVSRD